MKNLGKNKIIPNKIIANKMGTKEYLQQIRKIDGSIKNKKMEIESLHSLATSTVGVLKDDVVKSSGSKDKIGDAISKIIDLENEINEDIEKMINLKREIMTEIDKLDSPFCDILYKRYFQFLTWEKIAVEMNISYQWVCKLHGRALSMMEKRMKGHMR